MSQNIFPLRNELKYYIRAIDVALLQKVLPTTLKLDEFSLDGSYHVRSLYFDDAYNRSLHEKNDGLNTRTKVRIRIYNKSAKVIKLEIKEKEEQYIKKHQLSLSEDETLMLIQGKFQFLRNKEDGQKFLNLFQLHNLRPVIIVDYERCAYVKSFNNVRITIDQNVSASFDVANFFNKELKTKKISNEKRNILEVKYNGWLPYPVKKSLGVLSVFERAAISKYVGSRNVYADCFL